MNGFRAAVFGIALGASCMPAVSRDVIEPVGGINFWCALFQTVKLVSLVSGQLEGVVVGAIGGGIACGMGW